MNTVAETIEEIVAKATFNDDDPWEMKRPRVNEFVNAFDAVDNGDGTFRRDAGAPFLARVKTVRDDGFDVEIWNGRARAFVREAFLPVSCIMSRCGISAYSLTGEF